MEILPNSEVLVKWASQCGIEETCLDKLEAGYSRAFHGQPVSGFPNETYASFFLREGDEWVSKLDNTDSAAFSLAVKEVES